jgi:hypothetical protein
MATCATSTASSLRSTLPTPPSTSSWALRLSINDSGVVTGFYYDTTENSNLRVFIRAANGTFTVFDTPQLGFVGDSAAITPSGAIAGNVPGVICGDTCTDVFISFLRSASGKISAVSDPVAPQQTGVTTINQAGVMAGFYLDENLMAHAFVRTR